jgi:hypothetical protein
MLEIGPPNEAELQRFFGSFHRRLSPTSEQTIGGRPPKVRLKSHSLQSILDVSPEAASPRRRHLPPRENPPFPAGFVVLAIRIFVLNLILRPRTSRPTGTRLMDFCPSRSQVGGNWRQLCR